MEKKFVKLEEALKDVEVKAETGQVITAQEVVNRYGASKEYGCWFTCKCDVDPYDCPAECTNNDICRDYVD